MPDSNDLKSLDSQLKKTLISAESFKKGSSINVSKSILNVQKTFGSLIGNVRQLVASVVSIEKIVNNNSRKITSLKNISKTQSTRISGENIGAKLPGSSASNVEDSITKIAASVDSIAGILAGRKKALDDTAAFDRRKAEQEKRGVAEGNLEKKFEGLKSDAEKVIAPVKSILDKIIDFFVTVFLGRVVYKLLEWFSDKKNADKVKSIGRFLKDFGPAILSAFILFGTSFGRLTLGLTKMIGGFIFKIGKVLIPQLLKLIAKNPKAALAAGLFTAGATIPAVLPGTVDEQEKKTKSKPGSTEDKIKALEQQKANLNPFQKMQGVGSEIDEQLSTLKTGQTKSYGFSGGGFNSKGMLGSASMGALGGPLGILLGGALGSGKPQEMFGGFVSGEKGVDKVPAMLTDGEFVMSAGAVQKYGVDTLEGMNAAGGGTNKPKMISGTTYAAGGGYLGENPDPNYKNPGEERRLDLIKSLERYGSAITTGSKEKGGDLLNAIKNLSSTLSGGSVGQSSGSGGGQSGTGQSSSRPRGSTSTGSLLTDPLGAAKRILGIKDSKPSSSKSKPSSSKPRTPGFIEEIGQKLTGPGASTYLDAGSIYAKQMLGGFDGPISERNLGKDSKAELQKAIERAKLRTGTETAKAEAKIKELESSGASKTPDGRKALATQKSFLKKLKSGGIRVQYADYADSKGKMSDSAKNAKNILGQFWANKRSKEEGGGYRVEDKYDFDAMKKKDNKTGKMRDMNFGELLTEGVFGKGKTTQQRLQAAHQMNIFKGKGDVDMVLGGKRTAEEEMGLTGSKTLFGGLLGMSGKPKDKNTKAQIAKSKPKNVRGGGVKPSAAPKPKVVYGPPAPKKRNVRGGGSSTKTPSFSATTNGMRSKQETLGLMR